MPTGDAVEADPPHAVTAPAVTGSAQDGGTLSADTGSFTGTTPIAYTYQWQRCDADGTDCADIAAATTSTYTLASDDIGYAVRVVVTGTNVAGDDTHRSSTPSAAVTAAPPVSTTAPSIAGVTVDGQTLTADHGAFSGTGPLAYTYQWQRCDADGTNCASLPGETGSSYKLVSSDVGGAVRVIVTATNGAGSDSATSAATTEVLALAPANVTPPSISGTPLDGHTLTADPGTWSGTHRSRRRDVAAGGGQGLGLRRHPRRHRRHLHAGGGRHRPRHPGRRGRPPTSAAAPRAARPRPRPRRPRRR